MGMKQSDRINLALFLAIWALLLVAILILFATRENDRSDANWKEAAERVNDPGLTQSDIRISDALWQFCSH